MAKKMGADMIRIVGMNIISPLGFSVEDNFEKIRNGETGIQFFPIGTFGLPESFYASFINNDHLSASFNRHHLWKEKEEPTKIEMASILSAISAIENASIDPSDEKTIFIFSTTKGNISSLRQENDQHVFLWNTAEVIAKTFHNNNTPIVISNACISGACAQIAAHRALSSGRYNTAIVIGVDMLSDFIISGFSCLKALSQTYCRPFDENRSGLNLGEAAATIIYKQTNENKGIELVTGAIRNDANHISGPSRTGEGSYNALQYVTRSIHKDDIAFINAHGTATLYNDEMESIAITRANLGNIPINSLKGYFGHTLGAAGILESILSCYAMRHHTILATKGFEHLGVTQPIHVSNRIYSTDKKYCIKLLSGFGGCNAALLFKDWGD
jgi:3-oxoacyl-[acyl-carrier-protein] synthase-1